MMLARTALILAVAGGSPTAAAPNVVADVAPLHSILANVMEGVGEPALLLPPGASPHAYALHPSEAGALEGADLVFWVGEAYTPWLADAIATLAADAMSVALQDSPALHLLPLRESGPFARAAETADSERPAEAHEHDHAHEGSIDGHLWLDPLNAVAIARAAAGTLAETDPENGDRYRANADAFAAEIEALTAELGRILAPAAGKRFVVFHDAYQYFENRFGFTSSGSIALHDADQPSPARMGAIRERIRADEIDCVFAEPQFPASLVETAIEGTDSRRGTLDPIGAAIEPGPDFYPSLVRNLAGDLVACLSPD